MNTETSLNPTGQHHDPDTAPAVEVSDTQAHLAVDPEALTAIVRAVLAAQGIERASVSLVLVDDAAIHAINRRHLDHDWPTDVITFALSDPDDEELSGEIVVSVEMAVNEAKRAGVPAWDELVLYVVHGLLHLCGYDDTSDETRVAMRRREGEVLARLGLTNTFSAVDGASATEGGAPWSD